MSAGDMSGNLNSDPFRIEHLHGYAIQAVFSGSSPTGTFKLQASCDHPKPDTTSQAPTNWTDVSGSSQAVSANGNVLWDVSLPGYSWVRVVYTRSSGTGSCNIRVNGKE